ncbi:MAG: hypothetical protein L3J28_09100 [Candidatus Polarisedimenticolaceae bacterium]|nr:hypothetical protein [Candidatus Polarisedimenticolaceae bacterium]
MINLIVALPAEAKPLNQHLGLKRIQPDGDYPIYRNANIQLVLCGPGKQHAAIASLSLINNTPNSNHWINIGIAGHPTAAVGEFFQINRVIDQSTANSWNLTHYHNTSLPLSGLITVNEAVTDYPENTLYDMEAAGMVALLAEHNQLAEVTVLKIVSDNLQNPTTQINGRLVKSLINHHLDTIDKLLHAIKP